ncbi:MAG TPA: aminodeoxychorismate synthase component I [Dehalococcoidales bacterium]|nr:aminodeoxychorismate synthase component I [Dehalococcoidales bacterium]
MIVSLNSLPLIEELPAQRTALELFEPLSGLKNSFWLESGMDPQKLGRYSFMGTDPFLIFKSRGWDVYLQETASNRKLQGNPLDILGHYLEKYRLARPNSDLPCCGGAVGYLSYDLGRLIENIPQKAVDDLGLPECLLGFYDVMLIYDHLLKKAWIVSSGWPEETEPARHERARARLLEFKAKILSDQPACQARPPVPPARELSSNFTHENYVKAVERARQYIIDGDIFEVNLSQRFTAEVSMAPFELYRRLRQINPAPFACYLNFDEVRVVGSSPERFLRLQGDRVETRPIKGTIRRGHTPEQDKTNADWLQASEKDRAENMMIVDLERNDLGRVCRYGSVKVTELAILETFPTVFHLTSTVVGQLREGVSRIDLLKATFPGGSITGAPKIRSMEIIDELEPTRRSLYTGSIGYFSFDGDLDLNIVIRTFLLKDQKAYFQLGGAVVFDSDPEAEYQETLDKGKALFRALMSEK